jgi:hypothetical protein
VAEEEELAAGVGPACPALVARPAGDGRFDDDSVARLDPGDAAAHLIDDSGALVPGDEGVGHTVVADGIREIVMKIAAADTHGPAPDEDIVARTTRGAGTSRISIVRTSVRKAAFMAALL